MKNLKKTKLALNENSKMYILYTLHVEQQPSIFSKVKQINQLLALNLINDQLQGCVCFKRFQILEKKL
jgi:hypothetical protein